MNLAAGLTPAWQQILVFDEFRLGEVNRAREARWCASGKVLNAGIALHCLGGESKTVALVGGPPLGEVERELSDLGVPHRFVVSKAATRVCTTILDRSGGRLVMTELVENARPMGKGEYEEFLRVYEEEAEQAAVVVLTGSLPQGTSPDFYRDLLRRTPGRAVLDIRGEELLRALELRPFVVKPNREELGRTMGRSLGTDKELRDALAELHRRGAAWIVVSQGSGPLWISSSDGPKWRVEPVRTRALNPIGCGDCLAAGIAWGIGRGRDVVESVKLGVAAATQNLEELLPARIDPETVEKLAAEVEAAELR